jgi:hypothetical protein
MSEQEQGWHRYISVKMDRFQDGNARLTSWPLSASEAADLGEGLGCSAASSRASPVVSAVLEASLPLSRTSAATGRRTLPHHRAPQAGDGLRHDKNRSGG